VVCVRKISLDLSIERHSRHLGAKTVEQAARAHKNIFFLLSRVRAYVDTLGRLFSVRV
jgi:hypothetical protein